MFWLGPNNKVLIDKIYIQTRAGVCVARIVTKPPGTLHTSAIHQCSAAKPGIAAV